MQGITVVSVLLALMVAVLATNSGDTFSPWTNHRHQQNLSKPEALLDGRNFTDSLTNIYYDYDAGVSENGPDFGTATTSDDIYPNPDEFYNSHKSSSNRGAAAAASGEDSNVILDQGNNPQEIKSSNFVRLNGISDSSGVKGGGGGIMAINKVLNRKTDVVDYELVGSGALDQDFKGHDLIDSIMYIYYGNNNNTALRKEVGGNIIVIGAVVALAAQILTIVLLALKNRRSRHKNQVFPVIMSLLVMTFLSNFLFIVGVQSSRNVLKCEIIAIFLHYLHLSTTFFVFLYIFAIYEFIKNGLLPNLNFLLSMGLGMPGVYIVFNYVISTSNYEINSYCWMSVKKGMIVNYMIPISFFIVTTAIYGTMCLRLLRLKQRQQFTESIESFIEHSRSEQMLNQIRQIGSISNQPPEMIMSQAQLQQQQSQQQRPSTASITPSVSHHRRLGRCHSNPSSTTLKKLSMANLKSANHTNSSINLTSTSTTSPTKVSTMSLNHPGVCDKPCCDPPCQMMVMEYAVAAASAVPLRTDQKSICGGESKYELGSISLANLSIQSMSSETDDFEDYKSAVKFAILFQIMFSICWFLAVIALEYQDTSVMPIIFVIVHNLVNWILLAKCNSICPLMISTATQTMTATESQTNSFSKKADKLKTLIDLEKQVISGGGGGGGGDSILVPATKGVCVSEEDTGIQPPLIIPFDDAKGQVTARINAMDTIPLLTKNAGGVLRTDRPTSPTNARIVDDESAGSTGAVDGDAATDEDRDSVKASRGPSLWGSHSYLDTKTGNEFISTIST